MIQKNYHELISMKAQETAKRRLRLDSERASCPPATATHTYSATSLRTQEKGENTGNQKCSCLSFSTKNSSGTRVYFKDSKPDLDIPLGALYCSSDKPWQKWWFLTGMGLVAIVRPYQDPSRSSYNVYCWLPQARLDRAFQHEAISEEREREWKEIYNRLAIDYVVR